MPSHCQPHELDNISVGEDFPDYDNVSGSDDEPQSDASHQPQPPTHNTTWRIRLNILPFRTWETILLLRNFNWWVQYTYFEFKLLKLILLYFWYNTRLSELLSSRLVSSQNRFGIRRPSSQCWKPTSQQTQNGEQHHEWMHLCFLKPLTNPSCSLHDSGVSLFWWTSCFYLQTSLIASHRHRVPQSHQTTPHVPSPLRQLNSLSSLRFTT